MSVDRNGCPLVSKKNWDTFSERVGHTRAYDIFYANNLKIPEGDQLDSWVAHIDKQESIRKSIAQKDVSELVINKMRNPGVERKADNSGYIDSETGELINYRVSDIVKQFSQDMGWTYTVDPDNFYGKKGTIIHQYLEEIGKKIVSGDKFTHNSVYGEVLKLKQQAEQFKDHDNIFFQITSDQFKTLNAAMRNHIRSIKEMQRSIDSEGKVEFFFEAPIYDKSRELAGTVDLVAVFSDGTASIYDYKSFTPYKKETAPGGGKVAKWDIQMVNYRNILKNNYGIRNFRESRILPIEARYSKYVGLGEYINKIAEGFQTLVAQTASNIDQTEHLNPIPIAELTGDDNLDGLVENLRRRKERLAAEYQSTKGKERSRIRSQLNSAEKSLRDLLIKKDISGTVNDVRNLISLYRDRMMKADTDADYMTFADLSDAYKELEVYQDISTNFANQLDRYTEKSAKNLRGHLDNVQSEIGRIRSDIMQEIIARFDSERYDDSSITDAGTAMTGIGKMMLGLQDWDMPVFQELAKIYRYTGERVRRQTHKEFNKIIEYDKAFRQWAKTHMSGPNKQKNKFKKLYNEKTGRLHSEFKKEFWDRRNEIRDKSREGKVLTDSEKRFIDTNFKFDKKEYQEQRDSYKSSIEEDIKRNVYTKEEGKKKLKEYINKRENKYNAYHLIAESNDSTLKTDEWKYIQQHKPLKEYYDMYIDYNINFGNRVGKDTVQRNFVANLNQNMLENAIEFGPRNVGAWADSITKNYEIRQNDSIKGSTDNKGNPINTIPLMFSDPIMGNISDTRKAAIEQEVEATHERGTEEFDNEVTRRMGQESYELGLNNKSPDLTKALMAFVHSINQYEQLTNVEGQVKALKTLVDYDKVSQTQVDTQNKALVDKYTQSLQTKIGLDSDMKQSFDRFVNRLIYQKQYDKDFMVAGKYSGNKMVRSMMNYFSTTMIGFNAILIAANFIQARSAFWMMSKEDIHFGNNEWKDTIASFTGRDERFQGLVDFFEPTTRDTLRERIELSDATLIGRRFRQRTAFLGHILGDENVDNAILVAMSKRYIIDSDGIIKNPKAIGSKQKIINPDAPTVYDSVVIGEEGVASFEGLSLEAASDFRAKVQRMANLVKGMMSEEQKGLWANSMVGTMLMQFRTWSVGLAKARFGKLTYDPTLESFEMGRFKAGMGEVFNGFKPSIEHTIKLLGEFISFGLYKKEVNQPAIDRKYEEFIAANSQYEGRLTKEQFIELQRAKLNSFLAEARVYLAFFVVVQLLGGLEWDDEDDGNLFSYNSHEIMRRALLEISFFWSPNSVDEIVKSPLPMWGMLQSVKRITDSAFVTGVKKAKGTLDEDDKGPGHYTLRLTPGINQVLNIFGYFDKNSPQKSIIERAFEED